MFENEIFDIQVQEVIVEQLVGKEIFFIHFDFVVAKKEIVSDFIVSFFNYNLITFYIHLFCHYKHQLF